MVTGATIATVAILLIGLAIVWGDGDGDEWAFFGYLLLAFFGALGSYILWSIVVLIRSSGKRSPVVVGIAILPGLFVASWAASVPGYVAADYRHTARKEHAEQMLDEFRADFGVQQNSTGRSSTSNTSSHMGCTTGKAIQPAEFLNHEVGFEQLKDVEAALANRGWATSTAVHVQPRAGTGRDEEMWAVAGTKGDEAIVFEVWFFEDWDARDRTFGSIEAHAGPCLSDKTITDLHWRFDQTSPLPNAVPNLHD